MVESSRANVCSGRVLARGGAVWLFAHAGRLNDQTDGESVQATREEIRGRASHRRAFGAIAGIGGV